MQAIRKPAILLLFLGGASALIYEVTWVRLLSLTFGVSVYAVSAVLTAFMGGLALGSWLFGRMAARLAAAGAPEAGLLRRYALLQAGVGVCALLAPLTFDQLTGLYVWIDRQFEPDFYTFNLIRFGLATLALLLPTTLMGGTLPLLSQALAHQERRRGADLGALYAANTFGAVLGTFAAGLFLIRLLGTHATVYLAAAIDLAVAGAALALSRQLAGQQPEHTADRQVVRQPERGARKQKRARREGLAQPLAHNPSAPAAPDQAVSRWERRLVLWGFALSGFAALGYEVVWTRMLAIFSLNAIFSFTVMLTTFLIGLAAGSALAARRADRAARPLALFGYLQLAIGLSAILVLFVFARLPTLKESFIVTDTVGKLVVAEFFAAGLTLLGPTLLMGATFPIAARVYAGGAGVGDRVGRLYALNTLGATLGSALVGFALIPLLGLQRAALTLALLNLAIGAVVLLVGESAPEPHAPAQARVPRQAVLGGALALAIGLGLLLPPGIYLGFREGSTPLLIFYREGIDATVSVFQVPEPPLKISFVNGRSEVPTDRYSMRAFYLLGHLGPLLRSEARSALVVSFGNGIASGALARHHIPRIEAVELVAEQVEAARFYEQENRGVLGYPGLRITIEDGRNYLLRSDERFDIITADATHPINTSSWALFTREFYTLTKQHLAEDGVFIQWLPFHDLALRDYRAIVRTFQSVFPHTSLWYTGSTHSFLVATPRPLTRADVAALDARIKAAGIADDLGDGQQLANDFLMDEQAVATYAAGAPVVSDNTAFFIPAKDMQAILQSFAPYAQVGSRK